MVAQLVTGKLKMRLFIITVMSLVGLGIYSPTANATTPRVTQTPIDCLTEAIVHETSGTSDEDRDAEGQLVLKRAADPKYPNSVCAVVHQKVFFKGKHHCQFDWYCHPKAQKPKTRREVEKARRRALVVWAHRDEAKYWAIEFNHPTCKYDHNAYYVVKRTRAQCYLAARTKARYRKRRN